MTDIPWLGWVLLGLFLLFFVAINWSLIAALRKKNDRTENKSANAIKTMTQSIKQPWKKEDEMLAELSRRANELRKPAESDGETQDPSK
ncbi:MAG TPA: hypothetical protein VN452_07570, partial [Longilinea sp.]|nr:hypothetical protein [Longilinea sp.]